MKSVLVGLIGAVLTFQATVLLVAGLMRALDIDGSWGKCFKYAYIGMGFAVVVATIAIGGTKLMILAGW